MPFEDVHGNGGLLTTVGDLLKWNEHFWSPRIADASFVAEEQKPIAFSSGSGHGYGLGLMIDERRGVRQIDHSGSTAGYLAHLARYPDQHVSVAVLCNVGNAGATQRAYDVADVYLAERAKLEPAPRGSYTLKPEDFERMEGLYRSNPDGRVLAIVNDSGALRLDRGPALIAQSGTRFVAANGGDTFESDRPRHLRVSNRYDIIEYERVMPAKPTPDDLQPLAGTYGNSEAETTFAVASEGDGLVMKQRPDRIIRLTPIYKDAFAAPPLGMVIFRRDGTGRITALTVS
jgi:hypothetical protein